jgi:probable phosphoglycerate mutase
MTSPTELWLVRHGETEWSRDARHTSITDLPLTSVGEAAARSLRPRLAGVHFDQVYASPRLRARRTADLAGFPDAVVEPDLAEWAYGAYEGLTMAQIHERTPGWTIWTHGGLDGESVDAVTQRLDRLIDVLRSRGGRVLCFGHGHALRALAARWIGKPVADGRMLILDTATISVLGDDRATPVIVRWNC